MAALRLDDMALMNVQLKDLTSAVRRTGKHAFDAGNHADIWLGEYVDPGQTTVHKVCSFNFNVQSFRRAPFIDNSFKVAIKVIRSAFTAEEVERFNEVSDALF